MINIVLFVLDGNGDVDGATVEPVVIGFESTRDYSILAKRSYIWRREQENHARLSVDGLQDDVVQTDASRRP